MLLVFGTALKLCKIKPGIVIMNKLAQFIVVIACLSFIFSETAFSDENLIYAVQGNDTNTIKDYISSGGDVNFKDRYGATALMIAAGSGFEDAVRILIGAKADVSARAADGTTAFIKAAFNGHKTIAKILSASGIKED